VAHNSYDEFWKKHAVAYGLKRGESPQFECGSWWDQEDFYGPCSPTKIGKSDQKNLNYLVVGPWITAAGRTAR